jgi:hypothetical protein
MKEDKPREVLEIIKRADHELGHKTSSNQLKRCKQGIHIYNDKSVCVHCNTPAKHFRTT